MFCKYKSHAVYKINTVPLLFFRGSETQNVMSSEGSAVTRTGWREEADCVFSVWLLEPGSQSDLFFSLYKDWEFFLFLINQVLMGLSGSVYAVIKLWGSSTAQKREITRFLQDSGSGVCCCASCVMAEWMRTASSLASVINVCYSDYSNEALELFICSNSLQTELQFPSDRKRNNILLLERSRKILQIHSFSIHANGFCL